jgi:hypothetical protein
MEQPRGDAEHDEQYERPAIEVREQIDNPLVAAASGTPV